MKVMPIVGVRPQIIKSAPVLRLLDEDRDIELQLIHSGQHYDFEMSKVFFNELDLPTPLYNLNVGSGSHATQTGRLIIRTERVIKKLKPEVVMVFGDANTTLAGALAAVKMHVPVCHVEAGLRSNDMSMPEEINRILTDHCSHMLCAPTQAAVKNLAKEAVDENAILFSGDTMYDAILQHRKDIELSKIIEKLNLSGKVFVVFTLHRAENVDDRETLRKIISAILQLQQLLVVFPVHPRTKKRLNNAKLEKSLKQAPNVMLTEPLRYFDMLKLMKHSVVILTDSGGMQKEAFLLHVPCVTLRYNTEWVETFEMRANRLAGTETKQILTEVKEILGENGVRRNFESLPNPYGDGKASNRIVEHLKRMFHLGKLKIKSPTSFLRSVDD